MAVTRFNGLDIESDGPSCVAQDRVFPLFDDESLLLAAALDPAPDTSVLDVGTGSGILALAAAQRGATVLATDVNPRAIACARHNTDANGFANSIKILHADVYTGLDRGKLDLIVANPPFLPTPPELELLLTSGGGPYGTRIVSPLIADARAMLRDGGRFVCLAVSFGSPGSSVAQQLVESAFSDGDDVRVRDIYGSSISVDRLLDLYARWHSITSWRRMLADHGLTELHYVLIEASKATPLPAPRAVQLPPESTFAGSWDARFRRYEAWFSALDCTVWVPRSRGEADALPHYL
ncbi:MAG: methyltransferase [Acidobacteria bacterium]|nr:methyltransferase [Acidobacteriota bacterium]MBV9477379.1 methyltransferase [Acidobacteriota bacterium]